MNAHDELATRFWARVEKSDRCWAWTGSVSVYGYGQFQPRRGESHRAHRLAYEMEVGPIPEGLVLDHLCRNRACVNPAHLEPVTSKENVLRGVGPSARNASKSHCDSGHEFDAVGSKGERRCTKCDNERTSRWAIAKRQAVVCGASTRDGGSYKMRVALGKKCRNHSTANPATVLHEGATK